MQNSLSPTLPVCALAASWETRIHGAPCVSIYWQQSTCCFVPKASGFNYGPITRAENAPRAEAAAFLSRRLYVLLAKVLILKWEIMGLPGQEWEENQGENQGLSLRLNKPHASPFPVFPPPRPVPRLRAIFKLSSQRGACVLLSQTMPSFIIPCLLPGGAAVGWVNPARSHRMSVSAEFCSVGPRLGNAPKCTQVLLYRPSSPSAGWCDLHFPDHLNLLQGGASLLWAAAVAVPISGVYI